MAGNGYERAQRSIRIIGPAGRDPHPGWAVVALNSSAATLEDALRAADRAEGFALGIEACAR